jgi:kynurenine 3-monooxygenase
MNAAFEDCLILYRIVKERRGEGQGELDLVACAREFSSRRMPSTDALADLCLEHYHDMASNTTSSLYLLRRKVEAYIGSLLPTVFRPLYSMVAFSDLPYHHAVEQAARQDRVLSAIVLVVGAATALGSIGAAMFAWRARIR